LPNLRRVEGASTIHQQKALITIGIRNAKTFSNITDYFAKEGPRSYCNHEHPTLRFSCGAGSAFKLSGTRLLEKHAIAPSAASACYLAGRKPKTVNIKSHKRSQAPNAANPTAIAILWRGFNQAKPPATAPIGPLMKSARLTHHTSPEAK
jgi:hypothetical protein